MITPDNIPNPNNPYDFVGAAHNEGLNYFIENFDSVTAPVDESLIRIMTDYGVAKFGFVYDSTQATLTNTYKSTQAYLSHNDNDIDKTVTEMISVWCVSDVAKEYMKEITTEILNYSDSSNIDNLITKIKDIEASILENVNLTDTEKTTLFYSSSTARYSSYYWFNVYNTEPAPWPTNEGSNDAPFWDWVQEHWRRIVATVCMDVATFITVTIPGVNITASALVSVATYVTVN